MHIYICKNDWDIASKASLIIEYRENNDSDEEAVHKIMYTHNYLTILTFLPT